MAGYGSHAAVWWAKLRLGASTDRVDMVSAGLLLAGDRQLAIDLMALNASLVEAHCGVRKAAGV
jgi:hypothetical protein